MPAIELREVSKIMSRRAARARSVKALVVSLLRPRGEAEVVSAARNVTLRVEKGAAVGIVGVNGAGKTTLLRLIAGITPPTDGTIHTEGRVLPLLELGAGFHPDLSGYENIHLQGALLGLSRSKVESLIPDIVAFAELEDFVHMPVRHYSSGMYVRLGFAISIHVDPDVLLIDETFSVGDLHFQRKCTDWMLDFRRRGGTFLLVSHDVQLIERVCDRALWLAEGEVVAEGDPAEVVSRYRRHVFETRYPKPSPIVHGGQVFVEKGRHGTGAITMSYVELLDEQGVPRHSLVSGRPATIRIPYTIHEPQPDMDCVVWLYSMHGHKVSRTYTHRIVGSIPLSGAGGELRLPIDRLDVAPGNYGMTVMIYSENRREFEFLYDMHGQMYSFRVVSEDGRETRALLAPPVQWQHHPKATPR